MITKTMWAYKSRIGEVDTFRLVSLVQDTPFIEAVYDPENKRLVLLNKHKVSETKQVPRLDAKGKMVGVTLKEVETYFEHVMEDRLDILDFISLNVINLSSAALKLLDE